MYETAGPLDDGIINALAQAITDIDPDAHLQHWLDEVPTSAGSTSSAPVVTTSSTPPEAHQSSASAPPAAVKVFEPG